MEAKIRAHLVRLLLVVGPGARGERLVGELLAALELPGEAVGRAAGADAPLARRQRRRRTPPELSVALVSRVRVRVPVRVRVRVRVCMHPGALCPCLDHLGFRARLRVRRARQARG
jgi:hypothetical protein